MLARPFASKTLTLRVHRNNFAQLRRALHSSMQGMIIHPLKVVDPAVRHEGFETNDSARCQFFQVTEIVRNQPAPEGEIHERDRLRCCELLVETGTVNCRRMSIEWHIEKHRPPASRQRASASFESLPMRAAGFVEKNVRINQPWEDMEAGCIDMFPGRTCEARFQARNLARDYSNVYLA